HSDPFIPQLFEQLLKLVAAAVNVADDVERTILIPLVIPKRDTLDGRRLDLLDRIHHEDVPESLSLQRLERTSKLRPLLSDDVRSEHAVISVPVAFVANLLRRIQHDGHRQAVVSASQLYQWFAGFWLNVGGI